MKENKLICEINIIPLVAITFTILVAFMVSTPMVCGGSCVAVPRADNALEDDHFNKETAMIIYIPTDGEYYIGKERIARARLSETIKKLSLNRPINDQIVYIMGGNAVSYGSIVDTLAAIRQAGIYRLALITEKRRTRSVPLSAGSADYLTDS